MGLEERRRSEGRLSRTAVARRSESGGTEEEETCGGGGGRIHPPQYCTVRFVPIVGYVCLAADWREGIFVSPLFAAASVDDLRRGCAARSTPARDTGNRPADVDRSHRQRKESQPHWPSSSADDSRRHVIVVVMTVERRATSYRRRAKKRRGPFFPTFPHNFLYGFFFLFGHASLAHCARRGTDKRSSEVRIFD